MRFDIPSPDLETQPFWDGCRDGALMLQHCGPCGEAYFPPSPYCPRCLSDDVEWKAASGRGRLHTYLIAHRPAPGFEADVPYAIAIVELDEGPRVMTNLVDCEPDEVHIGMPVEVTFRDQTDEFALAMFRPVPSEA